MHPKQLFMFKTFVKFAPALSSILLMLLILSCVRSQRRSVGNQTIWTPFCVSFCELVLLKHHQVQFDCRWTLSAATLSDHVRYASFAEILALNERLHHDSHVWNLSFGQVSMFYVFVSLQTIFLFCSIVSLRSLYIVLVPTFWHVCVTPSGKTHIKSLATVSHSGRRLRGRRSVNKHCSAAFLREEYNPNYFLCFSIR